MPEEFTLGVEEEYQIIDPVTRQLRPREAAVLPDAQAALGERVTTEFHQSQIEIATPVCRTLADVRAQLTASRRAVIEAAARDGDWIAAAGTHPFSRAAAQPITEKPRYQDMAQDYQALAHELVIFGGHVHVGLDDQEAAIGVLNRARHWLAPLLALSANSPFWGGDDTGYASYRTELWVRWPMAGPPLPFASRAEFEATVQALVQSGSISDADQDLLGHAPARQAADGGVPGGRRLRVPGRRRAAGGPGARPGADVLRAGRARRAVHARPSRTGPGGPLAGGPLRAGRRVDGCRRGALRPRARC